MLYYQTATKEVMENDPRMANKLSNKGPAASSALLPLHHLFGLKRIADSGVGGCDIKNYKTTTTLSFDLTSTDGGKK